MNDEKEFSPLQIRGFCVNGEIYDRDIVETEISPDNESFLQWGNGFSTEEYLTIHSNRISFHAWGQVLKAMIII